MSHIPDPAAASAAPAVAKTIVATRWQANAGPPTVTTYFAQGDWCEPCLRVKDVINGWLCINGFWKVSTVELSQEQLRVAVDSKIPMVQVTHGDKRADRCQSSDWEIMRSFLHAATDTPWP